MPEDIVKIEDTVPTVVPDQIITGDISQRAVLVHEALGALKLNIEDNFIDLCFLLYEASEGEYHRVWGYEQFGKWIENGSGLELSERTGFYYVNIAKKATKLGMTAKDLKAVRSSTKLKEIFTLDAETNKGDIVALLEASKTTTLADIKAKVHNIKNPSTPAPSFMTLKLEASVKEIVDDALELARNNYGSTMGTESDEITPSKCMELICVAYLQDVNNWPEGTAPTVPGVSLN